MAHNDVPMKGRGQRKCVKVYVNGLKFAIQDELIVQMMKMVEEAYRLALKAEEKLNRRSVAKCRGVQERGQQRCPRMRSTEVRQRQIRLTIKKVLVLEPKVTLLQDTVVGNMVEEEDSMLLTSSLEQKGSDHLGVQSMRK